jgi:HPt (histidine-containing phosphotransfer) domain-containing protein
VEQARTRPANDPNLVAPNEAFEKLRLSFHERLLSEQARLATLAGALGIAEVDCSVVFRDIATFAHRLRGAALIFEYREIAEVAKTLELAAAAAALDKQDQRSKPPIMAMVRALELKLKTSAQ